MAREYLDQHGRQLPGVTEILELTAGRRWGLERWRSDLGSHAEEVSAIALARGSVLHAEIAAYQATRVEPSVPSVWWCSIAPLVRALVVLGGHDRTESPIVSLLRGYGGTPDRVDRLAGRWVIHDWKTAAEPPTRAKLEEHEDQVAGYAELLADEELVPPEEILGVVAIAIPGRRAIRHPVPMADALKRWRRRWTCATRSLAAC